MVRLFHTELLKLKRAKMFLVSVLGAVAAPIMVFIGYLDMKARNPDVPIVFSELFSDTSLYVLLLIGPLLYGVITAYLFNREYEEDTLKNLLTIPVSRMSLIASKLVLLWIWILALTLVAWGLTLLLGLIGPFENLNADVLVQSGKQFFMGGSLLFLLTTPSIWITLLFKNYVPTIIFMAAMTMGNVALANREYKALFPWSAVHVIASDGFVAQYPPHYSYIAILVTSLAGLMATTIYFNKVDIH